VTRTVVGLVVLVVMMLASACPAAADDRIDLSRDGVTWSESLDAPLFDSGTRWVPGDVRSARFYVRNEADQDADLSIDVLGTTVDSLLRTGDLTVSARGGGGPWRDVTTPGRHRLVSTTDIESGETSEVDVTVAFAPASANGSQARTLDLDLLVRLTQDPSDLAPDGRSLLPTTGGPAAWVLITGLALLGAGILAASRRRDKEDHHA